MATDGELMWVEEIGQLAKDIHERLVFDQLKILAKEEGL